MTRAQHITAAIVLIWVVVFVGPGTWGLGSEVLRYLGFLPLQHWPHTAFNVIVWLAGIGVAIARFRRNRPYVIGGVALFASLLVSIFALLSYIWTALAHMRRIITLEGFQGLVEVVYAVIFLPSFLVNFPVPLLEVTLPTIMWTVLVFMVFLRRKSVRL